MKKILVYLLIFVFLFGAGQLSFSEDVIDNFPPQRIFPGFVLGSQIPPQFQVLQLEAKNFLDWLFSGSEAALSAATIAEALFFLENFSLEGFEPEDLTALKEMRFEFIKKVADLVDKKYSTLKYENFYSEERWGKELEENNFCGVGIVMATREGIALAKKREEFFNGLTNETRKNEELFKKALEEFLDANKELVDKLSGGRIGQEGLQIVEIIPNGPAEKAGLKEYCGWFIKKVDETDLAEMSVDRAIQLIRGPKDTQVVLTLTDPSGSKEKTFIVVREKIDHSWIEAKMVTSVIGYLRINQFEFAKKESGGLTEDDFVAELKKAAKKLEKAEGFIIDLSDNPGGFLNQADIFLDRILPAGLVEIVTENKMGKNIAWSDYDTEKSFCKNMVLIVNKNSASASEIIALALKEHKKAVLVGERTVGKGTAQTMERLFDGSVLKFTVAKFFGPVSGKSIEGIGVEPHIMLENMNKESAIKEAVDVLSNWDYYSQKFLK